MARQFIYHMHGLTKAYPSGRKVLENVNLSFYPDAKIGVLGPNGSGKSTLLRIMAGLDKEFGGEAWVAEGATVGFLSQEPQLDPSKDALGNVMEGVAAKRAVLDRYNELMMNYSDETQDEAAKLQDTIDAQNLWDLDTQVEQAMDALRCPPGDADVANLSGGERRRVALTRLLLSRPDLLLLDEPTNHLDAESVEWLEHHLHDYPGAILIVTHDRYFLDNVTGMDPGARSRPRRSLRGQLLRLPGPEGEAVRAGIARGRRPAEGPRPRARVDRGEPQGPPGEIEGAHQGL